MAEQSSKSNLLRTEGLAKVTGSARYIDDLSLPGVLYGATIRANVPRGVLRQIHFEGPIPWHEFTIVTAQDIPGKNYISMIENDWPFLVEKNINHNGEAVALIAHSNRQLVEKARDHIRLEIEELPAVLTLEDSLKQTEVVWGQDNILKSYHLKKGDTAEIFANAPYVIEGVYETGAQEQLYIENNGMMACYDSIEGVTVWGSLQCPYYIHKALMPLFALPAEKIRIIQAETGGGFGGKEEFPSLLAGHCALLAFKAKRPVKMIYSRTEDMANTTKRHPSRTRHKTAVDASGRLLAMDIEFLLDGGAYLTLSSVVLSRGCVHSAGPYKCENVNITAKAMATNTFPYGAFRGFGAPQSIFALERHLDVIAETIGLSPIEIRRRNFLHQGDQTATGQVLREEPGFNEMLDRALRETNFQAKQDLFTKTNPQSKVKRGIGLASFMHGAGFTGSGEAFMGSIAAVQANTQGQLEVLASSAEIGQGKNTVFTEIVTQALPLLPQDICIINPDTHLVPDSGPTVASRTSMVVGKLIESAAIGLRQRLCAEGYLDAIDRSREQLLGALKKAAQDYALKNKKFRVDTQYKQPPNVHWNDQKYQGDAYATYAWAIYVAEVSVDTVTYETKCDQFYALQEVGKVLHPILAAGQIEGGVAQAIGWALYEKVVMKNGIMINNQMTNYIMPTASDVPEIRVDFEERNQHYGPKGAKGIGELPMDGPAPAVINALAQALGSTGKNKEISLQPKKIPYLPEDLFELLSAKGED